MIGIAVNVLGILAGGVAGLTKKKPLSQAEEEALRKFMGLATVIVGLRFLWLNLSGGFGTVLKHLGIVLLSMTLGRIVGKIFRLQKISNSIGRNAAAKLSETDHKPGTGFVMATMLLCAGPLSVLASVDEAINGFSLLFIIKALTDGLATLSFTPRFGWNVILAAIPVVAWQGAIFVLVKAVTPLLLQHDIAWAVNATNGLLTFSVALVILQLKRVEIADYLPSLAIAPLLAYWWK